MKYQKKVSIYVVRHGQTSWNALGRYQGYSDIELDEVGRKQAQQASPKIKDIDFQLAYTSDLKRARQTYSLLGIELEEVVDKRLREVNIGDFEGKMKEEMGDHFDKFRSDASYPLPGGESMNDVRDRISSFFEEQIGDFKDATIIVTHGFTMTKILGLCDNYIDDHHIKNCDIAHMSYDGTKYVFNGFLSD